MSNYRALQPTICRNPACRYTDGGLFTICRLCGWSIFDAPAAEINDAPR